MIYHTTLSPRLAEQYGKYYHGPEYGLIENLEADSPEEAMHIQITCNPVEMSYNLKGEYMELTDTSTGKVTRLEFAEKNDVDRFIGEFEIEGYKFEGTKEEFEPAEEGDVLERTPYYVSISMFTPVTDGGWRVMLGTTFTEHMPEFHIQMEFKDLIERFKEEYEE